MQLSKLLLAAGIEYYGEDVEISAVVDDSRNSVPGALFVCVRGEIFDGHEYAQQAINAGAVAVICEREIFVSGCENIFRVTNARRVLSLILNEWYGCPGDKLKVIAVTGTNGKTSTVCMMSAIFSNAGFRVGVIGTLYCKVDDRIIDVAPSGTHSFTTPDQARLYKILAEMAESGVEYVFMEASSHALAQYRLDGIKIFLGIFTNLSVDHLDFHGDMERYFFAKSRLFDISQITLSNVDDKYGRVLADTFSDSYTYGRSERAQFRAVDIKMNGINGVSYLLSSQKNSFYINSLIPGKFTVDNTLATAGAALLCGVEPTVISNALLAFRGVEGRMEKVETEGSLTEISVFIDYAHTPEALEKVLLSVREFRSPDQNIITVFGCGGDRDRSKRKEMGRIATKLSDVTVITSDNSRSEPPAQIIKDIMRGVDKEKAYKVIQDRKEAIRYAIGITSGSDIVLLCGKGHEKYEIDSTGKHPFDEKEIVRQAILDVYSKEKS